MYRALKIFIVFKLSLCGFATQAQFVYFDSLYDSGFNINEGINSEGVIAYEDSIFSVLSYSANPSSSGQLYYFEVNYNGELISEFLIENEIPGRHYGDNLIILSDSIAMTTSFFTGVDERKQQCLTQFNRKTGELIWRTYYGILPNRNYPTFFVKTFDDGYAITGQTVDSIDAQVSLIKTDNSGNLQWAKYYGGTNYEGAYSLVQTPDSGYLLLGFTQSFGAGQEDFYLVKTDKSGNQEWQKTYGSANIDVGWGILCMADNNYLLTGGFGNGNAVLIKINTSGSIIWQKNYTYLESENNYLNWTKELPDGNLISVGITYNLIQNEAGFLVKTDSAGNLIWQRKYNKNDDVDLFYSVLPISDGGYLLGGQARNDPFANQDAWLLKVDDLGCPYANCTVGIDENDNTKVVADIWPNPAGELLNIEFQNVGDWVVMLTDINGKIVYQSTITDQKISLNVSGFANGMYLFRLASDISIVNKKIIIQH